MEALGDWLRDVLGWVLAVAAGWVTFVTVRLYKQSERLAVLEKTVTDLAAGIPQSVVDLGEQLGDELRELTSTIKEMRKEGAAGRSALYEHVDDVRKELKADLNRLEDKLPN